ncbi:MAG: SLBB domain-containing protein [Nitrospirae bacterium]|nr:SLBB domain-containing protein [Nitrospirota bacterium]MBI5696169.1 SLBB domain-containing protein [Nitrospirota bacterium]
MRSKQSFIAALLFLSAVLVSGVVHAQDYVLGEGDLLTISVYDNPDLTTQARVSGENKINFPLVGGVEVGGMTIREAERKLSELLADGFIVNPQVNIFVQEYHSKRVTILGEINKPGVYELSANVTILELISKAEGLTPNAGETILIKRKKDPGAQSQAAEPKEEYISVNLKDLMEKGNLALNESVQDGDNIYVSKSGVVYVTGEVSKPGAYNIADGTTVMKAIALAGGLTDMAAPNRTVVIRKVNGEEKTIKVEMGFIVQPDDVVSVPESFF